MLRSNLHRRGLLPVLLLGLAGCASGRAAVVGPLDRPDLIAGELEAGTALSGPTRLDFTWRLNEAGSRIGGVGVARLEAPYRARLDLFLDNGETVVAAALVDDELRLPAGAPTDVLPPAELMWGTLGVFRPVEGMTLVSGVRLDDGGRRFTYDGGGRHTLTYEVQRRGVLRSVEVVEEGSVVEWVRLEDVDGQRFPRSVTYRNLVDFRELTLTRTAVRAVDPFDTSIWDPRG